MPKNTFYIAILVATTMAFHIYGIYRPVEIVLWAAAAFAFLRYIRRLIRNEIHRCFNQEYLKKKRQ